MQLSYRRIGWLATLLACSSSTSNSATEPAAAGPQQAYPLDPGDPAVPAAQNSAENPAIGSFDDAELNPLAGAMLGTNDRCLAETQQAEQIGLDILVMLDSSGSMNQQLPAAPGAGGAATKWDAVRQSLEAFVQAPETREIGVGLQYFPQQQMVCDEPLGLCADLSTLCSPSSPSSPCGANSGPCLSLGTTGCLSSASCDAQRYETGNVSLDFLKALDAIRSSAAGCEFGLQTGSALDFDRVNLKLTQAGVESQLFNASSADGCQGDPNGWYYVRDPRGTPTQIEVCPQVCSTLRQGLATVDLQIGCATLIR